MLRTEAIDLLDNLIGMVEDNQESDYDTALKMGKQALSQEGGYCCRTCKHTRINKDGIWCEEPTCQWEQAVTNSEAQEPCDDAVSRQAVLNAIEHEDKWLLAAKGHNGLTEIAFSGLKARVDALPPVTHKSGKWIPVSERLPEDAYGCLVTVYDTDLRTQDEFENILPYFVGYDGETWNNAFGEPIPFEVIAWMPLPEPYEPQERSDKE